MKWSAIKAIVIFPNKVSDTQHSFAEIYAGCDIGAKNHKTFTAHIQLSSILFYFLVPHNQTLIIHTP